MELPVGLQLRELGLALALGAAFGILYDLLRPLRRGRITTSLTDLLYVLAVFISLPAFALYAGRGRLRLFALGAMALSGGLWLQISGVFLEKLKKITKKKKKT
jgi:hypothetical protein